MERPETTEELPTTGGRTRRLRTARARRIDRDAGSALVLGRYRLLRRLGAGGFGVVWAALDERLEREVAVKVMPRDGADPRAAEREARAAARLNHPGIVALYELGADEESFYLVSELVHGTTFGDLARAGALSDRDIARIGVALCDALDHAHAREVIHRDVKPANVIVLAEPAAGAGFAKLTDFGVAHLAGADPLTRTGDIVGTLAYMAPEQAEGERVTPAADVYSLALTLYEGLAGSNPVRGASPAATARRVGLPVPSLAKRRRDLARELCAAIDAALDPLPEKRPPLRELRAALDRAAPHLAQDGGLVEPDTQRRFGIAPTSAFRRARTRVLDARREALDPAGATAPERVPERRRAGLAARAGAGVGAGLFGLLALEQLGPPPPFSTFAAGGAAALLVALLPRLGWIAAAVALLAWLASPEAGREGTALVAAAGLAAAPLLLPAAAPLWSLPALAPLLGAGALAPLYLVAAGFVPRGGALGGALRRAGLGAAGFGALAATELVSGEALLFGAPEGALAPEAWRGDFGGAASDALLPLVTSPALVAPAAVWALFAASLPLAVRGRGAALDIAGAALWAGGVIGAHGALSDLLAGHVALADPRGVLLGALLGGALAVAAAGAGLAPPVRPDRRSRMEPA